MILEINSLTQSKEHQGPRSSGKIVIRLFYQKIQYGDTICRPNKVSRIKADAFRGIAFTGQESVKADWQFYAQGHEISIGVDQGTKALLNYRFGSPRKSLLFLSAGAIGF